MYPQKAYKKSDRLSMICEIAEIWINGLPLSDLYTRMGSISVKMSGL